MRLTQLRRVAVLSLATASLAFTSACFGSFNLTRKVWGFNKDVSKDKFVREVVFLGMNIVPVYGIASFIDALIVNSIEFWTGTNPVQMTSRIQVNDSTAFYTVVFEKNGTRVMTLKTFQHDTLVATTTMRRPAGSDHVLFRTVVADGRTASGDVSPDGSAVLSGDSAPQP